MLKKFTVLVVTCCVGLCFTSQEAYAQEGGAEEQEGEVIMNADSSSIEALLEGYKTRPTTESLRSTSNEVPDAIPNREGTNTKPVIVPTSTEKSKVKEGKSDVSFNLLYYLFYKFKHVDISGS